MVTGGVNNSDVEVLDEITVTGGVNNSDVEVLGLELPEGDIDGDTTFTFGLKFVQNPGVFEGTFTHFLGFLLELYDSSLVDSSAFVDQVSGGGGLAGVDVTDNDNVN